MSKKVSRIVGGIMLAVAVVVVAVALGHPEMSFPWSNTVTYSLYAVYLVAAIVLLIAPFKNK